MIAATTSGICIVASILLGFGVVDPWDGISRYEAAFDVLTIGLIWLVLAKMDKNT